MQHAFISCRYLTTDLTISVPQKIYEIVSHFFLPNRKFPFAFELREHFANCQTKFHRKWDSEIEEKENARSLAEGRGKITKNAFFSSKREREETQTFLFSLAFPLLDREETSSFIGILWSNCIVCFASLFLLLLSVTARSIDAEEEGRKEGSILLLWSGLIFWKQFTVNIVFFWNSSPRGDPIRPYQGHSGLLYQNRICFASFEPIYSRGFCKTFSGQGPCSSFLLLTPSSASPSSCRPNS